MSQITVIPINELAKLTMDAQKHQPHCKIAAIYKPHNDEIRIGNAIREDINFLIETLIHESVHAYLYKTFNEKVCGQLDNLDSAMLGF